MVVRDVVGDALVPRTVQMDLPRRPHDGADRSERPSPCDPQLRRARKIPDIGLAPEHEHIEVVRFHLSQRALTPAESQCPLVGQDLCVHTEPYGVYG